IPYYCARPSCATVRRPPWDTARRCGKRGSKQGLSTETESWPPTQSSASRVRSAHQIAGAKKPVRKRTLQTSQHFFSRQRLWRVRDLLPLLRVVPVDNRRPLLVAQVAQFPQGA